MGKSDNGARRPGITQAEGFEYLRLDPIPDAAELSEYYQSCYYDHIRKNGLSHSISRLLDGGEKAAKERDWIHATIFADIRHCLDKFAPGKRVLEVGAGIGSFLQYLSGAGYETVGLEPSREAVEIAAAQGANVHLGTLEEFIAAEGAGKVFDTVVLLGVLEHLPAPAELVRSIRGILADEGVLVISVPNDFSAMQIQAQKALQCEPWWLAVPDHINYFGFSSLQDFLSKLGFAPLHTQSDFPMEMFLLMGDNYVGNPELGGLLHAKRVRFELSLPAELRRQIYQAFAQAGVGRSCLLIARKSTMGSGK